MKNLFKKLLLYAVIAGSLVAIPAVAQFNSQSSFSPLAIFGTDMKAKNALWNLDMQGADVKNVDVATITSFDNFPVTPSSAPSADYELANKKYVDDNSALLDDGTATGQMSFWNGSTWTYTETSELFWDDTNKRLGIGIATPNNTIQIAGLINFDDTLYNIALGKNALASITTGTYNVGIGENALNYTQDGIYNTAIGFQALEYNVDGDYNVALGAQALNANVSGTRNMAIGRGALQVCTVSKNVAVGYQAATSVTTGEDNVAIGNRSLRYNQTGSDNVAIGSFALESSTGVSFEGNVAIGYEAGGDSLTGNYNTLIGHKSGNKLIAGAENTFLGRFSGYDLTSGSNNVFLGHYAGRRQTTNSNLLIVDNQARADIATEATNAILYGTMAALSADQDLRINAQLEIANTTDPQLKIIHTVGVDEAKFYVDADGALFVTPTSRSMYLGDGTAGDSIFGFAGATTIFTLSHDDSEGTLDLSANDTTNYSRFASDGILTMAGTARVTKNIVIRVGGFKSPGSNPADQVDLGIAQAWAFDPTTQEYISTEILFPEDMDMSVAPTLVADWSASATTGTAVWQLEYLYRSEDEDMTASAQATIRGEATPSGTSNGLVREVLTGFAVPSATDRGVLVRISRDTTDGTYTDDMAGDANLTAIKFQYTSDKLGTAL